MIEITAIKFGGGEGHEHITDVLWRSGASAGQGAIEAVVEWLGASSENQATVRDGSGWVAVAVVRPIDAPPYIRTHADGIWTDHLLTLPVF